MLHWYNEINAHNRNGQGQSIYVLDYEWLVKCPNFGENQLFSTEVQHKTMDTCSHIGLSLFYTPVKTTCSEQKLQHNNRCLVELSIHLLFNVSNIFFFTSSQIPFTPDQICLNFHNTLHVCIIFSLHYLQLWLSAMYCLDQKTGCQATVYLDWSPYEQDSPCCVSWPGLWLACVTLASSCRESAYRDVRRFRDVTGT